MDNYEHRIADEIFGNEPNTNPLACKHTSKRINTTTVVILLIGWLISFGLSAEEHYTTLKLPRLANGEMVMLIDWDSSEIIDSLPVINETVRFRSDSYRPAIVKVSADNMNYGSFILDNSTITLDVSVEEIAGGVRSNWLATGGYNDSIPSLNKEIQEKKKEFGNVENDQERERMTNAIQHLLINKIDENADNIFGVRLFLMAESIIPYDSIVQLIDRHPALLEYNKIKEAIQKNRNLKETSPGHRFKDFTATYGNRQKALGDVAGKGDYVLLDFWAFWCGPCRQEIPYIKEVYNHYKDRNIKIIGIAVSDEAEKDLKTAIDLELPWEIWVDGAEALGKYSIISIPHLILIGPDGNILERGFRSENIMPTIEKYLE